LPLTRRRTRTPSLDGVAFSREFGRGREARKAGHDGGLDVRHRIVLLIPALEGRLRNLENFLATYKEENPDAKPIEAKKILSVLDGVAFSREFGRGREARKAGHDGGLDVRHRAQSWDSIAGLSSTIR
jgi:chloramphenicol 3-O-phosphotransferase